jgi:hypothetical protein
LDYSNIEYHYKLKNMNDLSNYRKSYEKRKELLESNIPEDPINL